MHGIVVMCTSVGTPFSLVTRLVSMVEELMHGTVAMYTVAMYTLVGTLCSVIMQLVMVEACVYMKLAVCTSVETPLSVVTQLGIMVEACVYMKLAMCTSVGTPLSVITQLGKLVED